MKDICDPRWDVPGDTVDLDQRRVADGLGDILSDLCYGMVSFEAATAYSLATMSTRQHASSKSVRMPAVPL
jgi:hypothetical protein